MKYLFICLTVICLVPDLALATPVSFKDGWGIMPSYGKDWSDLSINYSLSNRYAVGASEFYRQGKDSSSNFGIGQINYLLERWNELDSQANIFTSIGVGGRHDSAGNDALAGYAALEADYETRRIYTLFGAETLQSEDNVQFNRFRYRAGFSPYLANYNELQTWIVLQLDQTPEMQDKNTVTPLLRFFYDNLALEVGVSLDGRPYLGAMAHF